MVEDNLGCVLYGGQLIAEEYFGAFLSVRVNKKGCKSETVEWFAFEISQFKAVISRLNIGGHKSGLTDGRIKLTGAFDLQVTADIKDLLKIPVKGGGQSSSGQ
jgi:hypothetical protein